MGWGILGPGLVARAAVMPAIAGSPNGRIVAVGSRDPERAAAAVAEHAPGARAVAGYQAAIDDPAVEAVYIALPNDRHHPWTIAAARAGKHVLCEKPLARDAAEAEEMAAACAEAGVVLAEAIMYRYHPRLTMVRELIADGTIGAIRHVQAAFTFTMAQPENYRARVEHGGGALLDVGSYCVSVARWLIGDEPRSVRAVGRFDPQTGIDLRLDGLLDFPGGETAQILGAFDAAEHQVLTVVGATGTLTVPVVFTAWRNDPAPILVRRGSAVETIEAPRADPYVEMVEHFQAVVRGRAALAHPPADALANLRVLDALLAEARRAG